ncbi:MAG: DUF664 domain-containing protein [bacterium]|nr:DUF664 domain-containing protein [bacterium]
MTTMISDAILGEFKVEAASTRRMLEAVPEDQLAWQPHDKSMTLSRLAGHIAELPAWAASMVGHDAFDFATADYQPVNPESVEELLSAHDQSVAAFEQALQGADDATMMEPWQLRSGENMIFEAPCVAAMRGFVLNHVVHHRGQLSVYFRQLGVPVPQVYGPTADNPSF